MLPTTDETKSEMSWEEFSSKIDLKWGDHQVEQHFPITLENKVKKVMQSIPCEQTADHNHLKHYMLLDPNQVCNMICMQPYESKVIHVNGSKMIAKPLFRWQQRRRLCDTEEEREKCVRMMVQE